ncbi:MAG: methyltransferase domain-containing protein [Armatimonadetes bacterium]|nr:methyltransferase domain-containing protein [Armatimonadota bacterium]MDE2207859.1 methyltransferase domain-containing protein [Armatimonadota bacterium]
MMTLPLTNPDSPERIFAVLGMFETTEALNTALELDLFTAAASGPQSAAQIAAETGASERGVRILCDYLTVQGLLIKSNGLYSNPPDVQRFCNRKSQQYLGDIRRFLLGQAREQFRRLTEAVKSGGSTTTHELHGESDHARWVEFARSMAPMMFPAALQLAELVTLPQGESSVLDIAAGHGLFGIQVAARHPGAVVTAQDWPEVLAVARSNAEKFGVASRFRERPGDAFEVEFGTGFDAVLLPNFLHHFDAETIVTLLRKVREALAPAGKVMVLEFIPESDRVSPPGPALFSLVMLATTPRGEAWTFAEYQTMLETAGFGDIALHALANGPQSVVSASKA